MKLSKLWEEHFFKIMASPPKDSEKYEIYKFVKKNYKLENYIVKIGNVKERITLTKIQTSSGALPISPLRYKSP